jgi:predicted DNA binding CopG/RHH family protein
VKRPVVPKFASEADEAKWWDEHMGAVEKSLAQAIKTGRAGRGGPQRVIQERCESKNITIRMPVSEIERARVLAGKKGIRYQTYIKMLLREALDREARRARG